MELAGRDPDVDRRIGQFFKTLESKLGAAFAQAQAAGALADGVEPAGAARLLVCCVEGLRVIGKTAPTRAASQAVVDTLLNSLLK
jgi:TetR/AcrR family transcriptional repressor of nem operon